MHHTDSIEDTADSYCYRASRLFYEDPPLALSNLEAALSYEPHHLEALNMAGELHLFEYEKLSLTEEAANRIAGEFFDRALVYGPQFAEAWSGKARMLFYREEHDAAIEAADRGLAVLHLRVGFGMQSKAVFTNVAESLYNVKVKSLMALGRREEARQELAAGLMECPGSELLIRRVDA